MLSYTWTQPSPETTFVSSWCEVPWCEIRQVLIFFKEPYLLQSCNKQFRHLFFNHNPMSSEDQFLHIPSHFYIRCHPCTHSACCLVTVLSLTERMLNSEPALAWDGRMNKIISRCALCFHFIKYKYHGRQKPLFAAVGGEKDTTGTNSEAPCGQRPTFPEWAVKTQTLNGQLYPEMPYCLS